MWAHVFVEIRICKGNDIKYIIAIHVWFSKPIKSYQIIHRECVCLFELHFSTQRRSYLLLFKMKTSEFQLAAYSVYSLQTNILRSIKPNWHQRERTIMNPYKFLLVFRVGFSNFYNFKFVIDIYKVSTMSVRLMRSEKSLFYQT